MKYNTSFIAVLIFIFVSCSDNRISLDNNTIESNNDISNAFSGPTSFTDGPTRLGNSIDIPYTIENLKKAYNNLPPETKSQIDTNDIVPTHYYIRFYPKNGKDLDILRNIKPYIFLSEVPLDREIEVGGSYYHDPSIPSDRPTYQYTTLPVSRWEEIHALPVESEILLKAYMPDYDFYETKATDQWNPSKAYYELLKEAYRITGNDYNSIPETRGASWNPSGRVRSYDTETGTFLPVKGVRIRGTHLLKVKETLTNTSGFFTLSSFKNPVNLKIVWESDDWDIRYGEFGQATYDGPKLENQSWYIDLNASDNPKNIRYAAVHRAAFRYYYDDIGGLARPANTRKEKICYFDSSNNGCNGDYFYNLGAGVIHDIRIWGKKSSSTYRTTGEIFSTTAHELGHAAHYTWVGAINFVQYKKYIRESWAEFVEWAITKKEYSSLGSSFCDDRSGWNINSSLIDYSPLFIDLVDDDNQGINDTNKPYDEVSGYEYNVLNVILFDEAYGISRLKPIVKQWKPFGVTDDQIDLLFESYESVFD